MKLRIFVCDLETEGECFERNLFGNNKRSMNVISGDYCLL